MQVIKYCIYIFYIFFLILETQKRKLIYKFIIFNFWNNHFVVNWEVAKVFFLTFFVWPFHTQKTNWNLNKIPWGARRASVWYATLAWCAVDWSLMFRLNYKLSVSVIKELSLNMNFGHNKTYLNIYVFLLTVKLALSSKHDHSWILELVPDTSIGSEIESQ